MIEMIESNATNLEEVVQSRKVELEDEMRKTDMLLYRMLPPWDWILLKQLMNIAYQYLYLVKSRVGNTTIWQNSVD